VLVGQVVEAYEDPGAFCQPWGDGWCVMARVNPTEDDAYDGVGDGRTRRHAWVSALEAAP
jgi:hypothetical protein